MATTKKTTKKTPTRTAAKPAAAKKTAAKKTVAAKTTPKKPVSKKTSAKKHEMRSFRVAPEEHSFTNFRITRQTVYWIILVAFIVFVQLWILKLQIEVASLLDAQQTQLENF